MKTYIVIARVNNIDYLTKVCADTDGGAEHKILDLSICGKHTYGVTSCMAYNKSTMKYDQFIFNALEAQPVSFETLKKIIEKRNDEIRKSDEAEERIREIEKQIKALQMELESARAIFR